MKDKVARHRKTTKTIKITTVLFAIVCASQSTRQSSADTNTETYQLAIGRCLAEMQLLETRNAFRLPCSMRGKGTQAGQSSNSSLQKPKGLTKDTVPMSQALSSSYSNRWLWAVTDPSVIYHQKNKQLSSSTDLQVIIEFIFTI